MDELQGLGKGHVHEKVSTLKKKNFFFKKTKSQEISLFTELQCVNINIFGQQVGFICSSLVVFILKVANQ